MELIYMKDLLWMIQEDIETKRNLLLKLLIHLGINYVMLKPWKLLSHILKHIKLFLIQTFQMVQKKNLTKTLQFYLQVKQRKLQMANYQN